MSKKASKAAIGAFVIGAVALVVTGTLIFGSGRFLTEQVKFVTYFEGSVKGLSVGAPVVFKGVNVGKVAHIELHYHAAEKTFKIPVLLEIEPERVMRIGADPMLGAVKAVQAMVELGLRAQLELQSVVTGQLMVDLDFHPDKPARLTGIATEYPEIPTIPSDWEVVSKTLKKIPFETLFTKLTLALEGIERTVNQTEISESIINLNKALQEIQGLVLNVDRQVEPLAKDMRGTIKDIKQLVGNLDNRLETISSVLLDASTTTHHVLEQAEGTFSAARGMLEDNSQLPYHLATALEEIAAAARSIRALADYLEQYPDALLRGKGDLGGKPK